jgi:hypothetical protein
MASRATEAARARRGARKGKAEANIEWFIDDVQKRTDLTMHQRVLIAIEYLRDKVVKNISVPVVKQVVKLKAGPNKGKSLTRVLERSKRGEFPRADTTQLYKSIFSDVVQTDKGFEGYVGTPLDYGVILETDPSLDRAFLRRTLAEEIPALERILGAKLVT